ncbi:MAG TPA: hypothetical protein VGD45_09215 [Steroidobacter sp.]|uniref:hypothetical protein n=1 Tax=Steroidobacter sp. TaxID=1978227 RepID=UPI002ED98546
MDGTELWFGTLNGISVVYDPSLQVAGSRWVLLFAVPHQRVIPYQKAHARSVSKPLHDTQRQLAAAEAYQAWRATTSAAKITEAMEDIRRKDAFLAQKLEGVRVLHRRSLERQMLPYRGVTEPDGRGFIRNASCRGCHRAIGSDIHLLCNSCGWIVCSNCGTCGCQRHP